jgi:hypothetical protein
LEDFQQVQNLIPSYKDVVEKFPITVYTDKQSSKVGIEPINSIHCQNVMIRKKKKGKHDDKEGSLDAEIFPKILVLFLSLTY